MRILNAATDAAAVDTLLARDVFAGSERQAADAAAIVADVRTRGDAALLDYTRRFDAPDMRADRLRVPHGALAAARDAVGETFLSAVTLAARNLRDFHERQLRNDWFVHRAGGGWVGQRFTPIDRVGVYVPGGVAVLPSTLLHVAVPAQVAGVPSIAVCLPPRRDSSGEVHVLAAAADRH